MKTTTYAFVLFIPFVLLMSCSDTKQVASQETTAAVKSTASETNWDFFMQAGNGALEENTDTKVWTITFTNVLPDMLIYSDRPERESQRVTVAEFIAQWNTTFMDADGVEDSPNAALTGVSDSGEFLPPVPFVLTKPVYDKTNQKLTFTATLVNREIRPKFNTFKDVTLAIDSTRWWNVLFTCGFGVAGAVGAIAACAAEEVGTLGGATVACLLQVVADASEDLKCICEICKWKNYKTCIKDICKL